MASQSEKVALEGSDRQRLAGAHVVADQPPDERLEIAVVVRSPTVGRRSRFVAGTGRTTAPRAGPLVPRGVCRRPRGGPG